MTDFKKILLREQSRLESIIRKTGQRLKDAPEGTLQISKTGKWVQYYRYKPGGKKNGEYLPKTEEELICKLAQKSYDEKVWRLASKRLAQIKKITDSYEDDEIERIYLKEHIERKRRICPVEATWEQQMEKWKEEIYEGKEFQEGTPVILTEHGERVRSKSEKILADYFYRKNIPYKYERPLHLRGFGIVHPDFTFLSPKTRREIYWEHDGRMDEPAYAQQAVRKIQAYEENGIYPGERLILTFETEKCVLSTTMIEKLVTKYLSL